jgi:hypothetical protein
MPAGQDSASRDHSRGSQQSLDSKKDSSSSNSKASHITEGSHSPSYHSDHGPRPGGRPCRLHDGLGRGHSSRINSSGSSSSACSAEHWPFSVRNIEDLDGVINAHLDELTTVIRNVEYHEDNLKEFQEVKDALLWQIFLARTGACCQHSGVEVSTVAQGRDGLMRCWQSASRNKRRARHNHQRAEHKLADFVFIVYNLLKERDRRNCIARVLHH